MSDDDATRAHRLEIPRLVWRLEQELDPVFDAALEPLHLTIGLHGTLAHIAENPGVSAADLARFLQVSPQSVAHAVSHLEALAYIERRPHPIHGRILQIFATDAGEEAVAQSRAIVYERCEALLAVLEVQEQVQLRTWLDRLRERAAELLHAPDAPH